MLFARGRRIAHAVSVRIPGQIADDRRATELVAQRIATAGVDRAVLPGARGAGRAAGDELADDVEVCVEQLLAGRQRRRQAALGPGERLDDVERDGAAICEVGDLGCRKTRPAGRPGSRRRPGERLADGCGKRRFHNRRACAAAAREMAMVPRLLLAPALIRVGSLRGHGRRGVVSATSCRANGGGGRRER